MGNMPSLKKADLSFLVQRAEGFGLEIKFNRRGAGVLMKRNMVAFDCGNSSCRVILGVYDGEQITTEVISRIPNYMVRVHQYFIGIY